MQLQRTSGDKQASLSVTVLLHCRWSGFGLNFCPWPLVATPREGCDKSSSAASPCHGQVTIEWQLTSPFDPTADVEGGDQEAENEYVKNLAVRSLDTM